MKTLIKWLVALGVVASFGAQAATIGMGSNPWYTPTLANNLTAQGNTVTVYNSYNAATLAGLDVYIQDGNSYFNAADLDAFVFNGGTLIQLPWTFTHNSYTAATRVIGSRTGLSFGQANPGINNLDSGSWLLSGVTLPGAGAYTIGRETGNSFSAGAHQVLSWSDNTAMLGYTQYGSGTVVGLNLHLITSDSNPLNAPWSNQIIYNAVNHTNVPEPATLSLLGLGLAGLGLARRRKAEKVAA